MKPYGPFRNPPAEKPKEDNMSEDKANGRWDKAIKPTSTVVLGTMLAGCGWFDEPRPRRVPVYQTPGKSRVQKAARKAQKLARRANRRRK